MQDMLAHHGQALEMTALVPSRTERSEFRLLAERIDVSQRDELSLIQQWLRQHGQSTTPSAPHPHQPGMVHSAGMAHSMMPGMLTKDELAALSRTTGTEFERLFLQLMIRHHEGALSMVERLFGTPGAGQDSEIYAFATDVDTDQRAEIARMRALLRGKPTR